MTQERKESLAKKIKALLDKTIANGCTEEEAKTAAAHAQKLMTEFGISMAEIEASSDKNELLEQGVFETNVESRKNASLHHVHFCGHSIARFTGTEYFLRGETKIVYFGFKTDVAIAQYLTDVFRVAMKTEWQKYYASPETKAKVGDKRKRAWRDFCVGMAAKLSQRIDELIKSREDAMKPKSNSRALMVVKSQVVSNAYAELSKNFTKSRTSSFSPSMSHYAAGVAAGANVNIPAGGLDDTARPVAALK